MAIGDPWYLIITIPEPPLPATFDSGSVPPPPPPVLGSPDVAFDELFGHPVIARELPLPPPPSPPLPAWLETFELLLLLQFMSEF